MSSPTLSLGARYIFPVEGEPIADGLLEIEGGRIARLAPRDGRVADIDLGNAAITPGFVNAHTHLELAPLTSTGGDGAAEDPIAWLRRVVEQRRATSGEEAQSRIDANLRAALESGTTLIADITTAGASWGAIASAPIRGIVFSEIIGLQRMRALQTSQEAWEWLASIRPEEQVTACARPGLSPHAPYSTAGWLYHRAASSRMPLSTHLAELPEEAELLELGRGRLREFLEDLGAWDDDWSPIGPRPSDFVRRGELRQADWLIAHGTYLDPADFWQLRPEAAPDGQRVAVAYCPRTHASFGLKPHPFRAMLERGVVVCIGTDSRASTPSLSVLDEIRFIHGRDESISGALLLTMATLFGAWSLRADTVTGSLKPGKSADLAVVALPDLDEPNPYRLLLAFDGPVIATAFEGRFSHGSRILNGD